MPKNGYICLKKAPMQRLQVLNKSAGSGKTFELTAAYLSIVLQRPEDYKHILAITFTNKATAELKSRIIQFMAAIAKDHKGESPMLQKLKDQTGYSTAALVKNAQKTLHLILHDYSNFNVSTIDSFFQRIVRSFTKELDLPYGFDISLEQDESIEKGIEILLFKAGEDPKLLDKIRHFVEAQIKQDQNWKPENALTGLGKELFSHQFPDHLPEDDLLQKEVAYFRQQCRQFYDAVTSLSNQALQILDEKGLKDKDFNRQNNLYRFLKVDIPEKVLQPSDLELDKKLLKITDSDTWMSKSKIKQFQAQLDQCFSAGLFEIVVQIRDLLEKLYPQYLTYYLILKNFNTYILIKELKKAIDEDKEQKEYLLIHDTTQLIEKVMKLSGGNTPFIYEKISQQIRYLLLDEFQDTSTRQFNNLSPLIEETLQADKHQAQVFIVGDVKQSIYRWRGGEATLLLQLKNKEAALAQGDVPKTANTNYRSLPMVVLFNNWLFPNMSQFPGLPQQITDIYKAEDLQQSLPPHAANKQSGWVQASMLPYKRSFKLADYEEELLAIIADIVDRREGKSPYLYRNTCLLFRSNQEAKDAAAFLMQQQIPVISKQSLQLSQSPKVTFLITLMKWLQIEPLLHEKEAFADKTQTAFFKQKQKEARFYSYEVARFLYTHVRKEPLRHEHLTPDDLMEQLLPSAIFQKRQHLSRIPVYECVENLLAAFQEELPTDAFVQRFLDEIISFTQQNSSETHAFLLHWEEKGQEVTIQLPKDTDALQILTIHNAKGLEFDHVIYPMSNTDFELKANGHYFWPQIQSQDGDANYHVPIGAHKSMEKATADLQQMYQKEKEDITLDVFNNTYVAFTRAAKELYLLIGEKQTKKKSNTLDLNSILIENLNDRSKIADLGSYTEKYLSAFHFQAKTGENGQKTLTFGEKVSFEKSLTLESPGRLMPPFIHANWWQQLTLRSEALAFKKEEAALKNPIHQGHVLHELLENIQSPDEIDTFLKKMQLEGKLRRHDQAQVKEALLTFFKNPQIQPWFDGRFESLIEREILTDKNKILRPDRVMVKENHCIVLDYKSGNPAPQHQEQVQNYMMHFQKMAFEKVEGYLYYLNNQTLVEVRL